MSAAKIFKYEGINKEGKRISGELEMSSLDDVKKHLRKERIRATKIQAPSLANVDLNQVLANILGAKSFTDKDLARFTSQMATLLDAGVPVLQALQILTKQERSPGLKASLKKVSKSVSEGKSLYDAMNDSKVFSKLMCYMVKTGEATGQLDQVLNRLSTFIEKNQAIKKKVKGALTYPTILVVVGVGVICFLMTYVVPMFVGIIQDAKQEIPWVTQFVMDISTFFSSYILFIAVAAFAVPGAFIAILRTPKGKANWDKYSLKIPLFKDLIIKSNLSTFSQTLSTLLSSGIPILDGLDICSETIGNTFIASDILKLKQSVMSGKSISEPLKRISYFPDLVAQMIEVGESTGKLDSMLQKVAKIFEVEVEGAIQVMTQIIEPVILVCLGGAIAMVMLAIYLPIFMSAGAAA
jgi:type IV pilus assembly protein PilC